MIPGYKMKGEEAAHLTELFVGKYALMFWSVQIFGMIIPIILLMFKKFRRPFPMFVIAICVIVGAWFKRFLIVIPTLLHPFLPMQEISESAKSYSPTYPEWSITFASLAGALLIITVFIRYFPIISIWEVAEERGIEHDVIYKHLNELNEKE
jgi:molybdopterin-containing oxidoreductase family membrane subunit